MRTGFIKEIDVLNYVMLFCALMLVRNSKATLGQAVSMIPLDGKAKFLAQEIVVGFVA